MTQPVIGTPWKKLDAPVPSEELEGVEKYWRCANYLSVGQIYLRSNPLMRKDFVDEKTGEVRDLRHDGGIVYTAKGDYVLVVFTRDYTPYASVADLSRRVYDGYVK